MEGNDFVRKSRPSAGVSSGSQAGHEYLEYQGKTIAEERALPKRERERERALVTLAYY